MEQDGTGHYRTEAMTLIDVHKETVRRKINASNFVSEVTQYASCERARLIRSSRWADPAAARAERNHHTHLSLSRHRALAADPATGNDEQPEVDTPSPAVCVCVILYLLSRYMRPEGAVAVYVQTCSLAPGPPSRS